MGEILVPIGELGALDSNDISRSGLCLANLGGGHLDGIEMV